MEIDWDSYAQIEATGSRPYVLDLETGKFLDDCDPAIADLDLDALAAARYLRVNRLAGEPAGDVVARDTSGNQPVMASSNLHGVYQRRDERTRLALLTDRGLAARIEASHEATEEAKVAFRSGRGPRERWKNLRREHQELVQQMPGEADRNLAEARSQDLYWVESWGFHPAPPWHDHVLAFRAEGARDAKRYRALLFERWHAAMKRVGAHRAADLRPGVTESALLDAERELGVSLPDELRAWFVWRDGAPVETCQYVRSYRCLTLGESVEQHGRKTKLFGDGALTGAENWWSPGWIPLMANGRGDLMCVDTEGTFTSLCGQIIEFVHDDPQREVAFVDLEDWLETLCSAIERGLFVVDAGSLEIEDPETWYAHLDRIGHHHPLRFAATPPSPQSGARAERVEAKDENAPPTAAQSPYPPEVKRLVDALRRLPGVVGAWCGVHPIDVPVDAIGLVDFGHLPHATLRRTHGGLRDEILVQTEIELSRDDAGWEALELLAWHFRDAARGGAMVQMRPHALPKGAGSAARPRSSLCFHVDLFVIQPERGLARALEEVAGLAKGLETMMSLYGVGN